MYKYLIETPDGKKLYKADPYANYAELRPGSASIVTDVSNLKWTDKTWMDERAQSDPFEKPMAIYEVHGNVIRAVKTKDFIHTVSLQRHLLSM